MNDILLTSCVKEDPNGSSPQTAVIKAFQAIANWSQLSRKKAQTATERVPLGLIPVQTGWVLS